MRNTKENENNTIDIIRINSNEQGCRKKAALSALLRGKAAAPSSSTSRSSAARGLVGRPRGAACVTRVGLQALSGRVAWASNESSSSIDRGHSHDKGLFVNIWDSIPIYLEKSNIRE